jgi:methyl-accepting chemotaxis protein
MKKAKGTSMDAELKEAFAALSQQIKDLGGRIDVTGGRIDAVSNNLGSRIDAVSNDLGGRIDAVSNELGGKINLLGGRIDAVSNHLGGRIDAVNNDLSAKIDAVHSRLGDVEREVQYLNKVTNLLAKEQSAYAGALADFAQSQGESTKLVGSLSGVIGSLGERMSQVTKSYILATTDTSEWRGNIEAQLKKLESKEPSTH